MVFTVTDRCPECSATLRIRHNRRRETQFIGCSKYPACSFACELDETLANLAIHLDELQDWLVVERLGRPGAHPETLSKDLKALIFEWHPDRNPNGLDATKVVAELNRLRRQVAA